jgi:hypothetical protein
LGIARPMITLEKINQLEKAAGVTPRTTAKDLKTNSDSEIVDYWIWLRKQAPMTASLIPDLDRQIQH